MTAKTIDSGSDWRKFPALEKLGDARHFEAVMNRVETTCGALDGIRAKGTPAERDRANLAVGAYGRMLELVDEIRKQAAAATPAASGR
ncbi:MAG: hypothetical protein R2729_28005 [Bryobacteraceae bacterium]